MINLILIAISISSIFDAYFETNSIMKGFKIFVSVISIIPVLNTLVQLIRRPEVIIYVLVRGVISFLFEGYLEILSKTTYDDRNIIDNFIYKFNCCDENGNVNYRIVEGNILKKDYLLLTTGKGNEYINPGHVRTDPLSYTDLSGFYRIPLYYLDKRIIIRINPNKVLSCFKLDNGVYLNVLGYKLLDSDGLSNHYLGLTKNITGLGFINNELNIIIKESGIFLANLIHKLSNERKLICLRI